MKLLVLLVCLFSLAALSEPNDGACMNSGAMMLGLDWRGRMVGYPQDCFSLNTCLYMLCQIYGETDVARVAVQPLGPDPNPKNFPGYSDCMNSGAIIVGYDFNNTMITHKKCSYQNECLRTMCQINSIPGVSYVTVMPY